MQPPEPEFPEPVPERELRDLVERSRSGDSLAFARLYNLYDERVYHYAYFNVGTEQAADDLAARVFLKAWRWIRCYDPERQPFSVWLYLIARGALVDFANSRTGAVAVKDIISLADEGLASLDADDPGYGA